MLLESFEMHGGETLRSHSHERLHLCIVRSGGFVERHERGWHECGPGAVRVSPAACSHEVDVDAAGASGEIIELPDAILGRLHTLQRSIHIAPAVSRDLVRAIRAATQRNDPFAVECHALELVARSLRGQRTAPPQWLTEFRRELDANAPGRTPRPWRNLVRHRSHTSRTFREWFGRSIGDHLRARRLSEAARRLRESAQPISAIALDLEFTDQAHFTRLFKARHGVPPGSYRRAAGETLPRQGFESRTRTPNHATSVQDATGAERIL